MSEQNQAASATQTAQMGNSGYLNQMQTTMVGNIVSVTKYEIDAGTKGGSIWVSKPTSGFNENVLGEELIKIKIPFDLFDQLKKKVETKEMQLPGLAEILVNIDMGGQNKATLTAVSIRKYIPENPNQPKKPG